MSSIAKPIVPLTANGKISHAQNGNSWRNSIRSPASVREVKISPNVCDFRNSAQKVKTTN